jgi:pumilio RNA-binding family
MATESPVRLVTVGGSPGWSSGGLPTEEVGYHSNAPTLTSNQIYATWREHELVPRRSGSAPPNIEGSWTALSGLGGLLHHSSYEETLQKLSNSDEESLRSNPAYLEYYNSKVNLNPRLPPPLINREGRHLMHKIYNSSSLDDTRQGGADKGPLFIPRSVLSTHDEEPEDERSAWLDSGGSSSGARSETRNQEIADFTQVILFGV